MQEKEFVLQDDLTDDQFQKITATGLVGVDTETTGLLPHRDNLCMIQLSSIGNPTILIRRSDWQNVKLLKHLFVNQHVTKVFHFALMDCAFISTHLGVMVVKPYCTKIASRIARTYSQKHSLLNLVEEFKGLTLDKSQQSTDWCGQNLSTEQLQYAVNDSLWLCELKQQLEAILVRRGMLSSGISWIELNQQCQTFIPTLVHLFLNGWDFGSDDGKSVFSH